MLTMAWGVDLLPVLKSDPFALSLSNGFDKLSPNGIQDIQRPNP